MKPVFKNAWAYQGNVMDLPVADVAAAVPFYASKMGFTVESSDDEPVLSATLRRDDVRIRLAENGGDMSQDGCAFQIEGLDELYAEYLAAGLSTASGADDIEAKANGFISPEIKIESQKDGSSSRVFYIIAPDGLCYWLGEPEVSQG